MIRSGYAVVALMAVWVFLFEIIPHMREFSEGLDEHEKLVALGFIVGDILSVVAGFLVVYLRLGIWGYFS